jgi:hypothetical protein
LWETRLTTAPEGAWLAAGSMLSLRSSTPRRLGRPVSTRSSPTQRRLRSRQEAVRSPIHRDRTITRPEGHRTPPRRLHSRRRAARTSESGDEAERSQCRSRLRQEETSNVSPTAKIPRVSGGGCNCFRARKSGGWQDRSHTICRSADRTTIPCPHERKTHHGGCPIPTNGT